MRTRQSILISWKRRLMRCSVSLEVTHSEIDRLYPQLEQHL